MAPVLAQVGCPLCGLHSGAVALEENGYQGRRCEGCGLVYVSPRPPPAEILGIYEHDASQTRARQHVAKTRAPYALAHDRHLLALLRRHVPGGSLLEIGAGGGLFLHEARAAGFDVAAIEPNHVLATFIREQFDIPCETAPLTAESFGGRTFDAIVHCNVLSHFDDPVAALTTMAERLVPGGWMVMETGNFADVDPRYHGLIARSERFQLPEHLTFFGERSIGALLGRAGLVPVAIHRYSRIPEKRGPGVLRALGLGRWADRLRYFLKYTLGRWAPKAGRPQTLIVVARRG